jgi:hypothetical protein
MVTIETKDAYSSAIGSTRTSKRKSSSSPKTRNTGQGRQKVKDFFKKNDVLGKVGGILGVLGSGKSNQVEDSTMVNTTPIEITPEKKPMTTQTKILIGVGVLAVIGVGYYLYKKNN